MSKWDPITGKHAEEVCALHNADCDAYEARIAELELKIQQGADYYEQNLNKRDEARRNHVRKIAELEARIVELSESPLTWAGQNLIACEKAQEVRDLRATLDRVKSVLAEVEWQEPHPDQAPFDRGYNLAMSQVDRVMREATND